MDAAHGRSPEGGVAPASSDRLSQGRLRPIEPGATPIRVLIADDSEEFRAMLNAVLSAADGIQVVGEARDGLETLSAAGSLLPDVVVLDVRMPRMSGIDATRRLVTEFPGMQVVMFSGHEERDIVLDVVKAGARGFVVKGDHVKDIVRAVRAAADGRSVLSERVTTPILEELVQLYHEEHRRAEELALWFRTTTFAFAAAIEKRDQGTGDHSNRVVNLALKILQELDADAAADPIVEYGYLLHDLGKIGVPDGVLLKPGRLEPDELRVMRLHPTHGAEILRKIPMLEQAIPIVRHHHEWFDGTGYPDGLAGDRIPLQCRAFSVADAFDAMTSDRPYRSAMPLEAAMDELARGRASQFDPDALNTFDQIVHSAGH